MLSLIFSLLVMLFMGGSSPQPAPPTHISQPWLQDPEPFSVAELWAGMDERRCEHVLEKRDEYVTWVFVPAECKGKAQGELRWTHMRPQGVVFAEMSFDKQTRSGHGLALGAYTANMCTNRCSQWPVDVAVVQIPLSGTDGGGHLVAFVDRDKVEPGALANHLGLVEIIP